MTRRIAATYDFLNEGDTLTEAFILKLEDEEKQEICNSLNRRTEFKVLRTTFRLFEPEPKPAEQQATTPPDEEKGEENQDAEKATDEAQTPQESKSVEEETPQNDDKENKEG